MTELEEVQVISPVSLAVAKFLLKTALVDGSCRDKETTFIASTLEHMGIALSPNELDRLSAEAAKASVESLLGIIAHGPVKLKEQLLFLAMLLVATDGRVAVTEKKLLAQALPVLGISKRRYSSLAESAVAVLKSRKGPLAERTKPVAQSIARLIRCAAVPGPSWKPHTESIPRPFSGSLAVHRHDRTPETIQPVPEESTTAQPYSGYPEKGPVSREASLTTDRSDRNSDTVSPTEGKIWRCPACNMPQFREFAECPQCGVIVAKYKEKLARQMAEADPDLMIELPPHPPESAREEPAKPVIPQGNVASRECMSCKVRLPGRAKYCPYCGMRLP